MDLQRQANEYLLSPDGITNMELERESSSGDLPLATDNAPMPRCMAAPIKKSIKLGNVTSSDYMSFENSPVRNYWFCSMRARNGNTDIKEQVAHRANAIARRSYLTLAPHVLDSVRWVFSDNGLPRLKVLAIGDFSNAGRWAHHNMILCRDDSLQEQEGLNFRTLTDGDTLYWDMINDNMDLLTACPADPLFW